ncbi:fungal specific transcription factor domain protein [Colletotrichum tofieldiae]|uniref:Fungal specific transcription factor domain protein n=1 Tax=Colletotrichum tofieldiae TaxID=708197 RepID=A0A161WPX1_9PEZI|nr:fungal specific transcription factor domain protein [Colletotrichum tofieldiae]
MSSMPLQVGSDAEPTRQYRSRRRQRPCDRCRSLKLKCQQDNQPSCQRCQRSKVDCTFISKARRRTSAKTLAHAETGGEDSLSATGRTELSSLARASLLDTSSTHETPAFEGQHHFQQNEVQEPSTYVLKNPPFTRLAQDRPATQISQSLDQLPGCSMMLLGGSSGLDPWLLRHFRFDELGLQSFYKYHIRNAGGVPTFDKIPVHFILTSDELTATTSVESKLYDMGDLRHQLELLIPPYIGARLIRLFHEHIFPTLPIISRTSLGLGSKERIPDIEAINAIPTHLLAAIYGLALPFTSADEQLAAPLIHDKVPSSEIWRIAQSSFLRDLHKPHLSVLQAMLLYLHKSKENQTQYAVADTAHMWPFMGTIVGLAHNLGLQLECKMMGIPAHEKRVRRRLWWAVYIEDKFLSLLSGRPPYIHEGEWDVSELESSDFINRAEAKTPLPWNRMPFMHMANLAVIADSLQQSLYSLKSCQKLAEDLTGSIHAARSAFDALNTWRSNVPVLETISEYSEAIKLSIESNPSSVQFAYLILVTYVWRAVLRPTVRSQPPPPIIDVDQEVELDEGTSLPFQDLSWDFSDFCDIALDIGENAAEEEATILGLYQSALAWARYLLAFVSKLSSRHIGEFWHSWSQLSFGVVSSFITVLVVQAPNQECARRSKDVLDSWRRLLQDQSRVFPMLWLSFTQLRWDFLQLFVYPHMFKMQFDRETET